MDIKRLGNSAGKSVMLLHGNLMCWRQFEDLIPYLEPDYCIHAVSFDGFDGTGQTTYTTAQAQADRLAEYLDFGVLNRLILKVMPSKQYKTAHEKSMPAWALRFMGQTEEREGHMKKALKILRQAYPKLTTRCFPGYGHGDANHLDLPSPSTRSSATASITTSWVRTSRRCWRACGCRKRAACSCCMTI